MTYEEARNILKKLNLNDDKTNEAIKIAADRREKEMPKKVIYKEINQILIAPHCPSCNNVIPPSTESLKLGYCDNCGQRLDWGKEYE